MNDEDDIRVTVAEADGEEREVSNVEEARKVVWARMRRAFGADLEVARAILMIFTGKASFHDLDPAECFDLSFILLDENRGMLKEELVDAGSPDLARLVS